MPSNRKFYKQVIRLEILRETPPDYDDIGDAVADMTTGDASGRWDVVFTQEIDALEAVSALENQGSDSGFFLLTPEGEDADGN